MPFNEIEYISIENQTTEFPKHFHETFCISLIYKGIEQIDFENQSLFSEAGSISITNPYEVHSNPLIDIPDSMIDGITIAQEEFKQKKMPFIIRRPLPDGSSEYWKIEDFEILEV